MDEEGDMSAGTDKFDSQTGVAGVPGDASKVEQKLAASQHLDQVEQSPFPAGQPELQEHSPFLAGLQPDLAWSQDRQPDDAWTPMSSVFQKFRHDICVAEQLPCISVFHSYSFLYLLCGFVCILA